MERKKKKVSLGFTSIQLGQLQKSCPLLLWSQQKCAHWLRGHEKQQITTVGLHESARSFLFPTGDTSHLWPWIISGSTERLIFASNFYAKTFPVWFSELRKNTALVSLKSHQTVLPWEWSYPDEYFWYRSLPADICGLYSLSRQTLLNSDLQNQAEGERKTQGNLCVLLFAPEETDLFLSQQYDKLWMENDIKKDRRQTWIKQYQQILQFTFSSNDKLGKGYLLKYV